MTTVLAIVAASPAAVALNGGVASIFSSSLSLFARRVLWKHHHQSQSLLFSSPSLTISPCLLA